MLTLAKFELEAHSTVRDINRIGPASMLVNGLARPFTYRITGPVPCSHLLRAQPYHSGQFIDKLNHTIHTNKLPKSFRG